MSGRPNETWKRTMIEQLGSAEAVKAHMQAIGAKGGKKSRGGGFAAKIPCLCDDIQERHHKAQCAGIKGGRVSRRRSKKTNEEVI